MRAPIDNFKWKGSVTQLFGVSKNVYQPAFGIPGHNGLDIAGEYGQPILAAHDGIVTVKELDNDTHTKGKGLYLYGPYGNGFVTTLYWHLSDFNVSLGQQVKEGDVIGFMGNTGFVNPPPSATCPHCGTHLHFGCMLHNQFGNAVSAPEYKNFIDPVPLLYKKGDKLPINFPWNLTIGSEGDVVSWLQTCLKLEGYAQDYQPIGYFGYKTLRDVLALQKRIGLIPFPAVGPGTRKYLNDNYS